MPYFLLTGEMEIQDELLFCFISTILVLRAGPRRGSRSCGDDGDYRKVVIVRYWQAAVIKKGCQNSKRVISVLWLVDDFVGIVLTLGYRQNGGLASNLNPTGRALALVLNCVIGQLEAAAD